MVHPSMNDHCPGPGTPTDDQKRRFMFALPTAKQECLAAGEASLAGFLFCYVILLVRDVPHARTQKETLEQYKAVYLYDPAFSPQFKPHPRYTKNISPPNPITTTIIMSDYQGDYDQNAARDAGYAAGAVGKLSFRLLGTRLDSLGPLLTFSLTEGDYNRVDNAVNSEEQNIGNDFRRDEQAVENAPENAARDVEQGFDNTVQGVENVPSDIGDGIRGAASWIGDKFGGAENEARNAENDVSQFDQGVDNAYNQGEQQGEQQGW